MNNEDRVAFLNGVRQVLQEFIMENAPTAVAIPEADSYAEYFLSGGLHFIGLGYAAQKWDDIPLAHLAYWADILRPTDKDWERNRQIHHDDFAARYYNAVNCLHNMAYEGEILKKKELTSASDSGNIGTSNRKGNPMNKCKDEAKLAELNVKDEALKREIQELQSKIGRLVCERNEVARETRDLFGN